MTHTMGSDGNHCGIEAGEDDCDGCWVSVMCHHNGLYVSPILTASDPQKKEYKFPFTDYKVQQQIALYRSLRATNNVRPN